MKEEAWLFFVCDWTENNFGPEGGAIIVEILKTNTTLTSLNLAGGRWFEVVFFEKQQ